MSEKRTMEIEQLDAIRSSQLRWTETQRRDIKNFLGLSPHEQLPKDRIPPEGIDDEFVYQADTVNGLRIQFWQRIFPAAELGNIQVLQFLFGKSPKPDHPLARMEGFADLGMERMRFTTGGDEDKNYVELESRNLGLHTKRTGNDNTFTPTGRQLVEKFLEKSPDLIEMPGLRDKDRATIKRLIKDIKKQFEEGKLIPNDWTV